MLNQDYSPLSICTIQRAFLLVYLEKAELVTEYVDQPLRTVDHTYSMPSVIRLKNYITIPYKSVILTRQNIFKRDNFQCQYCGTKENLTLDHVVPRAKGGKSTWANLVTACKRCNAMKGDFLPEEIGLKILNEPFKPSYLIFLRDYSGYSRDEWRPYLRTGTEG